MPISEITAFEVDPERKPDDKEGRSGEAGSAVGLQPKMVLYNTTPRDMEWGDYSVPVYKGHLKVMVENACCGDT